MKIEIEPTMVIEMNDRGRDRSNEGGRRGEEKWTCARKPRTPHFGCGEILGKTSLFNLVTQ